MVLLNSKYFTFVTCSKTNSVPTGITNRRNSIYFELFVLSV